MRDNWNQKHWAVTIDIEEDPSIDGTRAAVHLTRDRQPDIFGAGWAVHTADDPEGVFAENLATARALTDVTVQLRTRYPRPATSRGGAATPKRTARRELPV